MTLYKIKKIEHMMVASWNDIGRKISFNKTNSNINSKKL